MNLLITALRRTYAALLLLLPGDIRARHGDEMQATSREIVEDTLRRRGAAAAIAAGLAECADVVRAAVRLSRRAPSEFRQDVAYAWRLMWRRPAFSATVIATLALGIGATTSVFSVVDALLLRPLPFAAPDRLVLVTALSQGGVQISISPRDFHDITAWVPSIASSAAYTPEQLNLTGSAEPERIESAAVSWNFFDVLGVRLPLGRSFAREEGAEGRSHVVVISDGLWRRRFGGDPSIVGRDARFDGEPFTIVGVAPPYLTFPGRPDAWRPLVFTPHQLDPSQRGARWVTMVARVKAGVDVEQAKAEVRHAGERLAAEFPRTHRGRGSSTTPLQDYMVRNTRRGLLALFGAVALVLFIACANVANLLLARSSSRVNEMAMRLALGASRARLLRQCLVENLLLTAIAAAAGLVLTAWGTRAMMVVVADALPRVNDVAVDMRVAAFALGTAIALAIVLGSVAALGIRPQVAASGRATSARARVVRRALVVAEIAVALVLLTAAGLFIKSLSRLYDVSAGFDPSNVLTFSVTMPESAYPDAERIADFVERLRGELGSRPGVESASGIFGLPMSGRNAASTFDITGRKTDPDNEPVTMMRIVTPGYFRTLRIPLKGRDFSTRDTLTSPGVVIINEASARKYWPGENPIGQRIRLHAGIASTQHPVREVIGVVADVRYDGLDTATRPEAYVPHAQHPVDGLVMTLRTQGEPRALLPDVRAVMKRLDPNMPIAQVATMNEVVAESVAARRFSLMLLSAFAGVALLLAAIGIYGVLSYTVGQRTKEIGVRMAMGAPRMHVLRLVVGEGFVLAMVGLGCGLGTTLAITRVIRGLLFEVEPYDPSTLAGVGVALLSVALVASYLPARRAARVDPVAALRHS